MKSFYTVVEYVHLLVLKTGEYSAQLRYAVTTNTVGTVLFAASQSLAQGHCITTAEPSTLSHKPHSHSTKALLTKRRGHKKKTRSEIHNLNAQTRTHKTQHNTAIVRV